MKKNMLSKGALPVIAALLAVAACNKEADVRTNNDAPEPNSEPVMTVPFTVTVGSGEPATRATVDADYKTLRFAEGDKLYITGTNVKGVLDITSGVGETTGATFSGHLAYSGEGSPANDLALTATLVSAQQTVGTEVSVSESGAVTVNYPTTAYCPDVATAVQKYSRLTGESTYAAKSFTLSQNTAFLNFEITFEDGTAAGTELTAVVSNGGAAIATGNVTTTTESEKVVAKFVLPVMEGTALSGAKVQMGDKEALAFGAGQTLAPKVYHVKKAHHATLFLTSPAKGQVIGSDGRNYAPDSVPEGVTKVAMIASVSGSGGLAIALADEGIMNWDTAMSRCKAKTPVFTNGTWKLPSVDEWRQMLVLYTWPVFRYASLSTAITNAGGAALQESIYWTSTESFAGHAHGFVFKNNEADNLPRQKGYINDVRACLAFSNTAIAPEPIPTPEPIPVGSVTGQFSVSDTKKVYFSKGNLQYVGTWQFAANQWECFGTDQRDDHRDLFGWGTKDNPNNVSENDSDYSWAEWGKNTITGGTTGYRTLTAEEWFYLKNHSTRSVAKIEGVYGLVLLPDVWTLPEGCSFTVLNEGYTYDLENANQYTPAQWALMEANGAVFLPFCGMRSGTNLEMVNEMPFYWSSTPDEDTRAWEFSYTGQWGIGSAPKSEGLSVRLVKDVE